MTDEKKKPLKEIGLQCEYCYTHVNWRGICNTCKRAHAIGTKEERQRIANELKSRLKEKLYGTDSKFDEIGKIIDEVCKMD